MPFTEFYCDPVNGSNVNSGDTVNQNADFTNTSGSWDGTSLFTVSGSPSLAGITVGRFASLYANGGTVPAWIARVTNVGSNTITLSTTVATGTNPGLNAGGMTLKVGGAWLGPAGAVAFPFSLAISGIGALTNIAGDIPRLNMRSNGTFSMTANVAASVTNGPFVIQGYTANANDGGRFTFDGGTSGASYILLTLPNGCLLQDAILQHNGATGSSTGITARSIVRNVTVHDVCGFGAAGVTSNAVFINCETYNCNSNNTANLGGFSAGVAGTAFRNCIAHHNGGSNSSGFVTSVVASFEECIAAANGADGFRSTMASGTMILTNCTAYGNGGSGLATTSNASISLSRCLFVSNTSYGVSLTNSATGGSMSNCAFFGNGLNQTNNFVSTYVVNTITCAAQPLTDPANGDFRPLMASGLIGIVSTTLFETSTYTKSTISGGDIGGVRPQRGLIGGLLA